MCASTLCVKQKCRHGTPITSSFMQASTIQPSQGMIIRNSDGNLMKSKGSAMTGNWVTKICLWDFFMVLLSFCFWKIKGINNLKSKEARFIRSAIEEDIAPVRRRAFCFKTEVTISTANFSKTLIIWNVAPIEMYQLGLQWILNERTSRGSHTFPAYNTFPYANLWSGQDNKGCNPLRSSLPVTDICGDFSEFWFSAKHVPIILKSLMCTYVCEYSPIHMLYYTNTGLCSFHFYFSRDHTKGKIIY